jgi:hypothetical protein
MWQFIELWKWVGLSGRPIRPIFLHESSLKIWLIPRAYLFHGPSWAGYGLLGRPLKHIIFFCTKAYHLFFGYKTRTACSSPLCCFATSRPKSTPGTIPPPFWEPMNLKTLLSSCPSLLQWLHNLSELSKNLDLPLASGVTRNAMTLLRAIHRIQGLSPQQPLIMHNSLICLINVW